MLERAAKQPPDAGTSLDPARAMARVFRVRRRVRAARDLDYPR